MCGKWGGQTIKNDYENLENCFQSLTTCTWQFALDKFWVKQGSGSIHFGSEQPATEKYLLDELYVPILHPPTAVHQVNTSGYIPLNSVAVQKQGVKNCRMMVKNITAHIV